MKDLLAYVHPPYKAGVLMAIATQALSGLKIIALDGGIWRSGSIYNRHTQPALLLSLSQWRYLLGMLSMPCSASAHLSLPHFSWHAGSPALSRRGYTGWHLRGPSVMPT